MSEPQRLSDMDINSYVDGELEPAELADIEMWLADHPEDAARVHAYKLQRLQLHLLYDLPNDQPLPDGVRAALAESGLRRWIPGWRQLAAGLVLLTLGGVGGWYGDDAIQTTRPASGPTFVNRAINAYAVFAYDESRPVEIGANDNTDYLSWLSDRLGQRLRTPDLKSVGFDLIGGRLVNDQGEPAALFMYEDNSGGRMTLYVRRGKGNPEADVRLIAQKRNTALYWTDRALEYALAGEMPQNELKILTKIIAQEIDANAAT